MGLCTNISLLSFGMLVSACFGLKHSGTWLPVFGETCCFLLQGRSGFHFEDSSNMFFRNVRNHLPGHVMAYNPADRG